MSTRTRAFWIVLLLIGGGCVSAFAQENVSAPATAVTQATGSNLHAVIDSGSTTAATQSGTWTVQPGNTANSTPWLTTDSGTSATGAAVPAKAAYVGTNAAGNVFGLLQCDKTAQVSISSATTTALVTVSGSTSVYVCSYVIEIQGVATTAGTLQLETGTGTACASGIAAVTPTYIGSTTAGTPTVITHGGNLGYVFKGAASSGLCAVSTSSTAQKVFVSYAQF